MRAIRNYADTEREFKIAKERLKMLKRRKLELDTKYLSLKAVQITDMKVDGGREPKDKNIEYVSQLLKKDKTTGYTLEQEIDILQKEISQIQSVLDKMKHHLKSFKGLEYKLYCKAVIEGLNITKAVETLASEEYMSVSTIWEIHKKIKGYLIENEEELDLE